MPAPERILELAYLCQAPRRNQQHFDWWRNGTWSESPVAPGSLWTDISYRVIDWLQRGLSEEEMLLELDRARFAEEQEWLRFRASLAEPAPSSRAANTAALLASLGGVKL